MNAASKSGLLLSFLILLGLGGYLLVTGGGGEEPPTLPGNQEPKAHEPQAPSRGPAKAEMAKQPDNQADSSARHALDIDRTGAKLAQGAMGVVVDPSGGAVARTPVFLMETGSTDLFRMLKLASRGVVIPPLARGMTDQRGVFRLGLRNPDPNKTYEVRIVSDRFVDYKRGGLHIKASEWYDAGRIQLSRGVVLKGRVTVAGSGGLPVPDAEVTVQQNTGMPDISPTPGREKGLLAKVDPTGYYRLENVPAGMVTVTAVAPGHARVEKSNLTMDPRAENHADFELPRGLSIAGVVTDADGNVVEHAKVEANAISSKTPAQGDTRTDRSGHFEILGLVEGPYLLTAVAPGYIKKDEKPVSAGEQNLQLVLEKQGGARIRVFGKNHALLRHYMLTVKSFFKGQDQYGNTDIPPQRARPDRNGVAVVSGLDPNSYVFQVEAQSYAKAFSQPFTVAIGGDSPLVEVTLNEGGVIEGSVVSENGAPLSGVSVVTMPNHLDENPFTRIFQGIIPFKITRKGVPTDAKGHFRIPLLNAGTYQLKFYHPEHFQVYQKGIQVVVGQTTKNPTLVMHHGALVFGQVRVDGKPAAQVKVTISSTQDPSKPTQMSGFNCEAISDNGGKYVFKLRVPPGRYQAMGARQTLGNPIMQIADFAKTKKEFTLGPGQKRYRLDFNISSRN